MAMTDTFVKDMYVLYEEVLHHVLDRFYKTQGRQGGLIILKMRNMNTGNLNTITMKAGTKLEAVNVEMRDMQYLYKDDTDLYFMDTESFETVSVSKAIVDDYENYLKEGDKVLMQYFDGKVVNIKRNASVVLEVTEAMDAVKGDTTTNAMKDVTVETGYVLKVPMFIKKGDKITINTESGDYSGRVN
jgi:elongation factor P